MTYRILFSNLGYARGIDGTLRSHLARAGHHLQCPPQAQINALHSLKKLLQTHSVDLCCIAEIDAGSANNRGFDQMQHLKDGNFAFGQAVNKYGERKKSANAAISRGKSNGYLSRHDLAFTARFLSHGTKRLVGQLQLTEGIHVWFGHFSLRPWIRQKQFAEIAQWLAAQKEEVLLLGDFNNYHGKGELRPLTGEGKLQLLNGAGSTFRFSHFRAAIDLALATPALAARCSVRIVAQDFSDHDALLVEIA